MARIRRTFVAILTVALLASVLTAAPAHAAELEGSDLVVRLRGDVGEEVAGIYLNGEHHADLLATTDWQDHAVVVPGEFDVDHVQVRFENDLSLRGIDRNLHVESVSWQSETVLATDPSVYSVGAWTPSNGCGPGNKQSQTLHCRGFMTFLFGDADDSLVMTRLRGATGTEQFSITYDGVQIASGIVGQEWATFTGFVDGPATEEVMVSFTNDLFVPGFDRNLHVDWLEVDGARIESEDPSVRSNGSWTPQNGCGAGFKQTSILHCNGQFTFVPPLEVMGGSVQIEAGAEMTNSSLVEVEFEGPTNTAATEIRYSVGEDPRDAPWMDFQSAASIELGDPDGLRRVSAQFRDSQGRESAVFFDDIYVDTQAPEVELTSVEDGELIDIGEDGTGTGSFDLAGEVPLDTVSLQVEFSDGTSAPIEVGEDGEFDIDVSAPTSGLHAYRLVAVDAAGNQEVEVVEVEITLPDPEDTIIHPDVVMFDEAEALPVLVDAAAGVVEIGADQSEEFEVGDIVVIAGTTEAPEGFAGRITGELDNDGVALLSTEPVQLDEIFRQLDLSVGAPTDQAPGAIEVPDGEEFPEQGPLEPFVETADPALRTLGVSIDESVSRTIGFSHQFGGDNATVSTNGSVTVRPFFVAYISTRWGFFPRISDSFLNVGGSVTARTTASAMAGVSWEEEVRVGQFSQPIFLTIAGVPVTLNVNARLFAGVEANATGSVTAASASATIEGGIKFDNGRFSNWKQGPFVSFSPPEASGSAELYAYARAELSVDLYRLVEGGVSGEVGARLAAEIQPNGVIRADARLEHDLSVFVDAVGIDRRSRTLFGGSRTLGSYVVGELPQAPDPVETPIDAGNPGQPSGGTTPLPLPNPGGAGGDGSATLTLTRGDFALCSGCRWVHGTGSNFPPGEQFFVRCGDFVNTRTGFVSGRSEPVQFAPRFVDSNGDLSFGDQICTSNFAHEVEVWTESGVRVVAQVAAP